MEKGRPPKVDALVLCRRIGADREGKRWDLQGLVRHGRLESNEFPLTLPGLGVYISLTGMQGQLPRHRRDRYWRRATSCGEPRYPARCG